MKNSKTILILGDILAIAIVTIVGFITHNEMGVAFLPRMAAAFFPLVVTWLMLAPWFDLFNSQVPFNKMLGRLTLAIIFAAPLALVLRGFILNTPIIPIFAVVFTLTAAFGLMIWRVVCFLFIKK